MRDIRFRAWHKIAKVFWQWDDLNAYNIVALSKGIDPNYELSQFTGLKDKNGLTDIYEGDILADTSCPDESYIIGKVAYNSTPGCIYAGRYMLETAEGYAIDWPDYEAENWHNLEVIGNIYEHPELLK